MASGPQHLMNQKDGLERRINVLTNDELKSICRRYGYQVSGTKIVLQKRCLEVLNDTLRQGNQAAVDLLKYHLDHKGRDPPSGNANYLFNNSNQSSYQDYDMASKRGGGGLSNQLPANGKYFRPSPFYEILETLVPLQNLPEMPQNRHTVRAQLTIKPHIAEQFRRDNLKILMFCGEHQAISPYSQANVSFPNQIEVKVNDSEVKSNFKGLKNKPGSTKPADITSFIKKYKGEPNSIQLTYALTTRRFVFVVYLVRHVTSDVLTDQIKRHSVIRKQKVLDAMSKANADPDIAATSIRMSLKDPVSTLRITIPIRSSFCTHNQCFDGAMFMQLQEQAPQWSCPVCSKNIPFESLCVDEYFQEILDRTPITTEKVDIEPNGQWKVIKDEDDDEDDDEATGTSNKRARASYDDDFEDLVEIDQPDNKKVNGMKKETYPQLSSPIGSASVALSTPPVPSRETSAPQSANKRPQSAVIDLTLSEDDDDDEPPRPAKRPHTQRNSSIRSNQNGRNASYNTPTSIPDSSRYQMPHRTQPPQQHQQDNNPRLGNHNPPSLNNFHAPSISPPYQPSPPMQSSSTWAPAAPVSNYQHQSVTPSYHNNQNSTNANGGMYPPPASPVTLRPPPPPVQHAHREREQRDNFLSGTYSGYNAGNNTLFSPRSPPQPQQGGLRLPPMSAAPPPGQNSYGGGWRNEYDYGNRNWSHSPNG